MLTIYCVYVGNKYPIQYVYNLRKMVRSNLETKHRFVCISDRHIPIVETLPALPQFSANPDRLWWHKLALFYYADGPSLYFDLDTIICGDLQPLVPYTLTGLAMSANWPQSGHGGWQSSVMAWDGTLKTPYTAWKHSLIDEFWGDQEYISAIIGDWVTPLPPELLLSYKYHIQRPKLSAPPDDCVAVTFHGEPNYHEVNDSWIKKLLSTRVTIRF